MKTFLIHCCKPFIVAFSWMPFSLLILSVSIASDLIPIPTSSTGYQPQFQVSGNKIRYVWHVVADKEEAFRCISQGATFREIKGVRRITMLKE